MALPVLQCTGVSSKVEKGDELEVDIEKGSIKILRTGEVLQAGETPAILLEISGAGGMLEWIKSRRHLYKTLEQS
jgi:3-isopropylmalate/(R)-2-methylmalate dehydratase small subunit